MISGYPCIIGNYINIQSYIKFYITLDIYMISGYPCIIGNYINIKSYIKFYITLDIYVISGYPCIIGNYINIQIAIKILYNFGNICNSRLSMYYQEVIYIPK